MNEEAKQLIDRISSISDNVKKDLKPFVQKLAKNIGDNINKAEIKNLAALEGIKDPEIKDVASIMNRLRKKYEWSFGKTALYSYIQKEYMDSKVKEYEKPVRVNDNYIESHIDELKEKMLDNLGWDNSVEIKAGLVPEIPKIWELEEEIRLLENEKIEILSSNEHGEFGQS